MCNQCNECGSNNSSVGNTIINSSEAGRDGLSAYQIAVATGQFTGTESEYVLWLKGPKGDEGPSGVVVMSFTDTIFAI